MRIIDGYNLIGAAGVLGLDLAAPDKEDRLLRLLARHRALRRSRAPVLVVFDGSHGRLAHGPRRFSRLGIAVEYALGETADAVIARRVRSARTPGEVEVVTSDRELLRAVASWGARGTRSQAFADELARALAAAPGAEKPEAPDAADVARWLDIFGDNR